MTTLVLSASVGAGHVRAGRALCDAAGARGHAPVEHWDILDFVSRPYRRAYADGYVALVQRNPALWGYLYATANAGRTGRPAPAVVRLFDRLQFAKFKQALDALAPDRVIATHFLPCQVLAPERRRGRRTIPLGLVLTDFDAHALWVQPTADRFFVGNDEVAAMLAGRGLAPERIAVTGIPIGAAFAKRLTTAEARATLALPPAVPVVLVMGGGHGTGAVEAAVRAALVTPDAHVLAVAGRNAKLHATLTAIAAARGERRLHVFGFVDDIERLMAAADLVVTKSGGLTSAECLALGKPMLVLEPTPGQEERNCDHLLELGAARKAHGVASLEFKLRQLLAAPDQLRAMARAARAAGRPRAADAIVAAMEHVEPRDAPHDADPAT